MLCSSITALKNTQNSPLYIILKLIFLEIFKNESFRVFKFSWNFVLKKFPHWASWQVSLSIPENRIQKHPKLAFLQHFEVDIPEYFKWKFSFFSIFSQFFFRLMPGFLRLPHKLLRHFEISWYGCWKISMKFCFLKGLCRHYNVTSIYYHLWRNFLKVLKKLSIWNFSVKFFNTEKLLNSFQKTWEKFCKKEKVRKTWETLGKNWKIF